MIHDTQSAQISQKEDEYDIYFIMKTVCPPVITAMALWQLMCNSTHYIYIYIYCIYIYIMYDIYIYIVYMCIYIYYTLYIYIYIYMFLYIYNIYIYIYIYHIFTTVFTRNLLDQDCVPKLD